MREEITKYYNDLAKDYDADRFSNSYGQYVHGQEDRIIARYLDEKEAERLRLIDKAAADAAVDAARKAILARLDAEEAAAAAAPQAAPAQDVVMAEAPPAPPAVPAAGV